MFTSVKRHKKNALTMWSARTAMLSESYAGLANGMRTVDVCVTRPSGAMIHAITIAANEINAAISISLSSNAFVK